MSTTFDPYLEWLGLETAGRPPNHYQLLGLADFETDPAKIEAAADERMAEIRTRQSGPRGQFTHKLLNEIAAAKLCLLNERGKAKYDAELARERVPARTPAYYVPEPAAPDIVAPDVAAPPLSPPPAPPRSPSTTAPTPRITVQQARAERFTCLALRSRVAPRLGRALRAGVLLVATAAGRSARGDNASDDTAEG